MINDVAEINKYKVVVISTPVCDDILVVTTKRGGILGLSVQLTTKPLSTVVEQLREFFKDENIIKLVVDEKNEKYVESVSYCGDSLLCAMIIETNGEKHLKPVVAHQKVKELELSNSRNEGLGR